MIQEGGGPGQVKLESFSFLFLDTYCLSLLVL